MKFMPFIESHLQRGGSKIFMGNFNDYVRESEFSSREVSKFADKRGHRGKERGAI
jgi:hypothetical protein